jgi:hypothetical protein
MPIPEAVAMRQIHRFAEFPQFPETETGLAELVKAFVARSRHEAHAAEIGDRLMATMRFCPKPADVYDAADFLREAQLAEPSDWMGGVDRRPDDQPFNGLADLVDDRMLELLRRKAEQGKTHHERESAKQFLRKFDLRESQARSVGA